MPALTRTPTGTQVRYHLLRVCDELYAVSVLKVRGLLTLPVHMLAEVSRDQGCGLVLHEGRVLPAVDARVHFFGVTPPPARGDVVVIWLGLDHWWNALATVFVDEVCECVTIRPEEVSIQPLPSRSHPWLMGHVDVDGQRVGILDVDVLFEHWERLTGTLA